MLSYMGLPGHLLLPLAEDGGNTVSLELSACGITSSSTGKCLYIAGTCDKTYKES